MCHFLIRIPSHVPVERVPVLPRLLPDTHTTGFSAHCASLCSSEGSFSVPHWLLASFLVPVPVFAEPWFSSVQSLSCVQFFATPWTAARQVSMSFTVSQSLLKFMPVELVMLSNRLIFCCPFLLLLSLFPSTEVFPNESALHIRLPKYWSFNISPSNEYSGLISLRMDWVGPPCSPRDSQESSPTPQFKSVHSLVLSFLCSPTLTSIHDPWKNHSHD